MTDDEDRQLEENTPLHRRWFEEVVSEDNLALADVLLADDYAMHFPGMEDPIDREGHKQLVTMFRTGFPDWAETVEDVIAEGDRVVVRVVGRGTREGEFQGIAPTGLRVTATGVGSGRIAGGRIVETWAEYDTLGLMRQLGAIPSSGS